jgi:hypothetical protein
MIVLCFIVLLIALFVAMVMWGDEDMLPKYKPYRALWAVCFAVGMIGTACTPTRKDAMFIAGGAGVIEAAKAVKGSEIAATSVSVIEKWLKEEKAALQEKADERKRK